MKTDRLYAITVYLLNHGKTPAEVLARLFEVSVRTIRRDVDALCRSGIPVVAEPGAGGGYSLSEPFKLNAQAMNDADYTFILTALHGLSTAFDSPAVKQTAEKLRALSGGRAGGGLILDFSVLRETDSALLTKLQTAIREKRPVRFTYTNAADETRPHTVEPVAVVYRWYAWYLLAYSTVKDDYRTYKLVRMRDTEMTDGHFTRAHESAEVLLHENDRHAPPCTEVTVLCKAKARAKAVEYLNGVVTRELDGGDCEMLLHVVEREHLWFGTLLSLGDDIEVLSPAYLRRRIAAAAKKITALYGNGDNTLS